MRSGVISGIPYSLSRWTDIPASEKKWRWFESRLRSGKMLAFDSKSSAPETWSLAPADTLGLVFWTKNPKRLIQNRELLEPYNVVVHMTATGWTEAETGAPSLEESGQLLVETVKVFEKVHWRFSPIPLLPTRELYERFSKLLNYAILANLDHVYVSFLQKNDRMPELRSSSHKFDILNFLADIAKTRDVNVILCADDKSLLKPGALFQTGPCVQAEDFGSDHPISFENCGCVAMADPFTVNEACDYDCSYCYSSDKSLSFEKRDTL
jgi:hypothetical protein